MGYSKYAEDTERVRSTNIFGTVLDCQPRPGSAAYRCDFCSFETYDRERRDEHILKEHRESAIYLEYDDHVVPDRALFKVHPVELRIRCPALPRGIEVSVSSRSQARSNRRFQEGELLQITPRGEELFSLQLGVSAHKRHYEISFRHQTLAAKWTLGLLGALKSANSRISGWEESDLDRFKAVLLGEPGMNEDDNKHRQGIFEYYHALWLEQNRKPDYAKHFQEAFNRLCNFGDPLSQLIVGYLWYRVNCFDNISPLIPFPRLRRIVTFFAGPFDTSPLVESEKPKEPTAGHLSFEIAITDVDEAIFIAVSAIQSSRWDMAICQCDSAEARLLSNDDQAHDRVMFLRYRAHRLQGQTEECRSVAERLRICRVKSFRIEAENYLSSI